MDKNLVWSTKTTMHVSVLFFIAHSKSFVSMERGMLTLVA